MEKVNLKFNVAMDDEQKKAKNFKEVSVVVDFSEATRDQLIEMCKKPIVIALQSQIRNNWATFIKGEYPRELKFGDTLFESRRGGGVVTVDKAKNVMIAQLSKMNEEEKVAYLKSIGLL